MEPTADYIWSFIANFAAASFKPAIPKWSTIVYDFSITLIKAFIQTRLLWPIRTKFLLSKPTPTPVPIYNTPSHAFFTYLWIIL